MAPGVSLPHLGVAEHPIPQDSVMSGPTSGSRSPNSCNKSLSLSKNDQGNELKIARHAGRQFYEKINK